MIAILGVWGILSVTETLYLVHLVDLVDQRNIPREEFKPLGQVVKVITVFSNTKSRLKSILLMLDRFSKWVNLVPLKSQYDISLTTAFKTQCGKHL